MSPRRADALLIAATALWGVSFVIIKGALASSTPLAFTAVRFALAAVVLAPFARLGTRPTRRELADGALLAVLLSAGFATQIVGLVHTTPSRSAFIVASSSVLAPVVAFAALGQRIRWWVAAALVMAGLGVYLLMAPESGGLNRGHNVSGQRIDGAIVRIKVSNWNALAGLQLVVQRMDQPDGTGSLC